MKLHRENEIILMPHLENWSQVRMLAKMQNLSTTQSAERLAESSSAI